MFEFVFIILSTSRHINRYNRSEYAHPRIRTDAKVLISYAQRLVLFGN